MRSIEKRLVEAARTYHETSRKADSATWEFADTLVAFAQDHRHQTGQQSDRGWVARALEVMAEDNLKVVHEVHLSRLKSSAERWIPGSRVDGASWRAHVELDPSYRDQMVAHVAQHGSLTLNDAIAMKESHQPSRGITQPATTQQKVEAVREALSDPDVASSVVGDRETRRKIDEARDRALSERIETKNLREGVDSNALKSGNEDRQNYEVRRHITDAVLSGRSAVTVGSKTTLDDVTKKALRDGADALEALAAGMRDLSEDIKDEDYSAALGSWAGEVS